VLISALTPTPTAFEAFKWSHQKFVPTEAGCYVLATAGGTILYVGLASDLRRRMGQHLENEDKTAPTSDGRAALFYWLATARIDWLERGWMNGHMQVEGRLPILNKIFSPTD